MNEKENLVIVEHLNTYREGNYGNAGYYTFRVPSGYMLSIGDYVLVDTCRGQDQVARCVCNSFEADPDIAFPILGVKKGKLKPVKAVLQAQLLIDSDARPVVYDDDDELPM